MALAKLNFFGNECFIRVGSVFNVLNTLIGVRWVSDYLVVTRGGLLAVKLQTQPNPWSQLERKKKGRRSYAGLKFTEPPIGGGRGYEMMALLPTGCQWPDALKVQYHPPLIRVFSRRVQWLHISTLIVVSWDRYSCASFIVSPRHN
jgi:hypothetical protein